jgi:hypothetical protein
MLWFKKSNHLLREATCDLSLHYINVLVRVRIVSLVFDRFWAAVEKKTMRQASETRT